MQANEEIKVEERLEDITGITCIYVPVNDVYESIKWYQKNLGYQPANNDRVEPGITDRTKKVVDYAFHGLWTAANPMQWRVSLLHGSKSYLNVSRKME